MNVRGDFNKAYLRKCVHCKSSMPTQQKVPSHFRPTSETPFKWLFADGPIAVRFQVLTGVYIFLYEPVHEVSNNVVCVTSKAPDQPANTRSLIRAFASRLSIL